MAKGGRYLTVGFWGIQRIADAYCPRSQKVVVPQHLGALNVNDVETQ
jgi:hypothetical protein